MKRLFMLGFALLQIATVTACNTVAGAGEDVSHAGHKMTNEANENR